MRIGLAANRLHHSRLGSPLFDWLRHTEAGIRELDLDLCAVGGTYDAIVRHGLLVGYARLQRYPRGRDGGLVKLVADVVALDESDNVLDGMIYLVDPIDSSSILPEAIALKRQCVIYQKPFISTVASAFDWIEMERIRAGLAPDDAADRFHAISSQTLALIAHDALKSQMASFVDDHFELLSQFAHRVSTGTTGGNLNALAWALGWPQGRLWTECCRSGPIGGDAQIANLIFEQRCDRLFFFEDPHVARQHEADIQLLERAVTAVTNDVVCIASPRVARHWAEMTEKRAKLRPC
ncbi:methylglyoxal synthase [Caballeronia sp. SEWSISQ10-4 2]|uniref:methylglyoxal synthase n=1 Tax=Caballeronia sp. SEWSISQ10-4 2 TaxID=2937438 RepID=UPI00264D88FC|nr:methylglyoxal synthase [Caballeronia sp. SEWSISQ10-4 2]MDN7177665.1 methylglyoxal synthase [Caballeronia sp. SEWSISQ10-4 2]